MIDGDPIQARAQVPFGVGHQVAREGFDIGQYRCVFGRDDEPDAGRRRTAQRSHSGRRHLCLSAPNIRAGSPSCVTPSRRRLSKMGSQRRPFHPMAHDPGFEDGQAAAAGSVRRHEAGGAAAPERAPGRRC
jgi:hypothetical protein